MKPWREPSFCCHIQDKSELEEGSGHGRELSIQGLKPCLSARYLARWYHSDQLDLLMSRMRSFGQDASENTRSEIQMLGGAVAVVVVELVSAVGVSAGLLSGGGAGVWVLLFGDDILLTRYESCGGIRQESCEMDTQRVARGIH
jgi:hypothetical protein